MFYKNIGSKCNCAKPCESISFEPVLSYANFPSENFVLEMIKQYSGDASEEEKADKRMWIR